jgi:hypothetical protein
MFVGDSLGINSVVVQNIDASNVQQAQIRCSATYTDGRVSVAALRLDNIMGIGDCQPGMEVG